MHFTIRKIEASDVEAVYSLLVELAIYEQIHEKLTMTAPIMAKALFSNSADWHGFVAVTPSQSIVGFCLFTIANINRCYNTSTMIHLDDFYIKPDYRQYGLGKQLISAVTRFAQERNIARIELWCLKKNESGQGFYQHLGAQKLDYIDVYCYSIS